MYLTETKSWWCEGEKVSMLTHATARGVGKKETIAPSINGPTWDVMGPKGSPKPSAGSRTLGPWSPKVLVQLWALDDSQYWSQLYMRMRQ